MYSVSKSSLKFNNCQTNFLNINRGVRQGDSLSPTLFNIYINEIPSLFIRQDCAPLILENSVIGSLMFADDLLILSESEEGLQKNLDNFSEYCDKWQLTVNCKKTKTMVISTSNKNFNNPKFYYKKDVLEQVKEFKFLGNMISKNGNLVPAAQALSKKALKVMYAIKTYTNSLNEIPPNLSSHLFDSLVRPILTFNCEIWYMDIYRSFFNSSIRASSTNKTVDELSYIDKSPVERVHTKFTKFTLGLKKSACNISARAELGRFPIDCFIKRQSLLYDDRLYYNDTCSILKECISVSKFLHEKGTYTWYTYINHVRQHNNLPSDQYLNKSHKKSNKSRYTKQLHEKYLDIYNDKIQNLNQNSKIQLFKTVKMDYCTEYYLTCPVFETRKIICKFRTSDHPLAIETGRYKNIPREFRLCNLCKTLEDESHFFLYCKINDNFRTELFEKFNIGCKNNDAETI